MTGKRYFVRLNDIQGYHPANHVGTLNRRLIGPDTVGAKQLEVLH
ncbi:MAG: cupin domain-containing protein, partial [Burkholderia sp.]|nr:cupin domain-containing protein [Burkholderia sp.]